jgi:hypothetical protein
MRPDGLRGQHLLHRVARVVCGHGIECGAPPSIGRDVGLGAQGFYQHFAKGRGDECVEIARFAGDRCGGMSLEKGPLMEIFGRSLA